MTVLPSPTEIRAAAERIAGSVVRTALTRSPFLSAIAGGEVWLKRECEQHTGSFKIRGASNVLAQFTTEERAAGVVTSSAGNHGLGISSAARALGIAATIYVPASAPRIKRERIASGGATVDSASRSYDDAEATARAAARGSGAIYVSPCTGRQLLAGQGTVALEILGQLAEHGATLGTLMVCVGGGGLAGGVAGLLRAESPSTRIIGAQSELTNAMSLALASGEATDIPDLPTLADGLAGLVDDEMLAQGQAALDDIVTVSEDDIARAIQALWTHEGLKVEGGGAVGTAALMTGRVRPTAFPVVVIVSGSNIDEARHQTIVAGNFPAR
ncbi:MAG: pyridoxal-phosphate dependent enzyme [Gemmatimonadetes bacterium]|nr:pyridoxal-phosphate dependent enzyme [Gemmatimonadota bacterium]